LIGAKHSAFLTNHLTDIDQTKPDNYTVFRKKTPTHIFFHISMSDV